MGGERFMYVAACSQRLRCWGRIHEIPWSTALLVEETHQHRGVELRVWCEVVSCSCAPLWGISLMVGSEWPSSKKKSRLADIALCSINHASNRSVLVQPFEPRPYLISATSYFVWGKGEYHWLACKPTPATWPLNPNVLQCTFLSLSPWLWQP